MSFGSLSQSSRRSLSQPSLPDYSSQSVGSQDLFSQEKKDYNQRVEAIINRLSEERGEDVQFDGQLSWEQIEAFERRFADEDANDQTVLVDSPSPLRYKRGEHSRFAPSPRTPEYAKAPKLTQNSLQVLDEEEGQYASPARTPMRISPAASATPAMSQRFMDVERVKAPSITPGNSQSFGTYSSPARHTVSRDPSIEFIAHTRPPRQLFAEESPIEVIEIDDFSPEARVPTPEKNIPRAGGPQWMMKVGPSAAAAPKNRSSPIAYQTIASSGSRSPYPPNPNRVASPALFSTSSDSDDSVPSLSRDAYVETDIPLLSRWIAAGKRTLA